MCEITITLPEKTAQALQILAERCNDADARRGGTTTHGGLRGPDSLLVMLAEDAAMVVIRPGSWEAAGMAEHLGRHGYDQLT